VFSAINELLDVFLRAGGTGVLVGSCATPLPSWKLEAAGAALFGLALLSKESAVILLPLFLLPAPPRSGSGYGRTACCAVRGGFHRRQPRQFIPLYRRPAFPLRAVWITWPQSFGALL